jgi:hypothetical protein
LAIGVDINVGISINAKGGRLLDHVVIHANGLHVFIDANGLID